LIKIKKIFTYLINRPFIRDTVSTTIWGTFGKSIGFLIPFFIAIWFGVSSYTDAFFFAYGLVLFLSAVFAPSIENLVVPFIAEKKAKKGNTGEFIGKIIAYSGTGLFILSLIAFVIIRPILSFITDFDPETLKLIYLIFIETLPLIVLVTWSSVLIGYLNSYKKFIIPALSPIGRAVINLLIILTLRNILGVHAIAIGYVIGELFRIIFLFIFIKRFNLPIIRLSLKFNEELKKFFAVVSFQIVGLIAIEINPLVDRAMASWLDQGSVSILYYAERLYRIPITFMSVGLMATTLSYWSGYYYSKKSNINKFVLRVKKVTYFSVILAVIIMSIFIIFSRQIITIIYGRGISDPNLLAEIRMVWIYYLIGLVPSVVLRIFEKTHLTLKNTRFLMLCGFGSFFLNIILNYFLMRVLEVSGIALSTSITYIVLAVVYIIKFLRKTNISSINIK